MSASKHAGVNKTLILIAALTSSRVLPAFDIAAAPDPFDARAVPALKFGISLRSSA